MSARPSFTLGIEEEFQVIDPETKQLKSHIARLFEKGESRLKEQIKRELHQPIIEVGTTICADIGEARREVTKLRREIVGLAHNAGLRIAAAGTHPITHWSSVPLTVSPLYDRLIDDLQMVARANLIFGLHVHVAIEDNDARIAVMNAARYFLPHVFALSVNSPFWIGENTGWKSYRSKVFERFPRTGIPDVFESWHAYEDFINILITTHCMSDPKKIWWDLRVHPHYPTLEFRICDVPLRIDETICCAALFQAITYKLWTLYNRNQSWRLYSRALIAENKQRAARWGLDGKLVDFGRGIEVPTEELIGELLEFVDDVVDELGSRKEVEYSREIIANRPGADRQLRIYGINHSLPDVVDYIISETEAGID